MELRRKMGDMKPPLVSIIIPAYNCEECISMTIRSALEQTWTRKEIIIVDDGSTDGTLSVARQYESPILKVVEQENKGASSARNKGLQMAQGDYIQWLDSDDLIAPDKIERQLATLSDCETDYKDVVLTGWWGKFFFRTWKVQIEPNLLWQDLSAVEWLINRLSNPYIMPCMAYLVNRSLSDRAGLWDERLSVNDDGEYFCRIVSKSRLVKFVPGAKSYYRMANFHSLSHQNSRRHQYSLYLSTLLTIKHVLALENTMRTRKACVVRLNSISRLLEDKAPDLADKLKGIVKALGGEVTPAATTKRYELCKRIIGERNTKLVQVTSWRILRRLQSIYDYWMWKLFCNISDNSR